MTTVEKLKNRLQSLREQHALEHQKCEAAEAENVEEKFLTEMNGSIPRALCVPPLVVRVFAFINQPLAWYRV